MATIDTISGPAGANAPSPAKPTWFRTLFRPRFDLPQTLIPRQR
jgi:hypothetical protein